MKKQKETYIKEKCIECKFLDYYEWEKCNIDTCYCCNKNGSMKEITGNQNT